MNNIPYKSNDQVIRSNLWQIFWKITVLNFFPQNSQENTTAGVSFLIKLQTEKFFKIHKKYLCWTLEFNKVTGWKISQNSQENTYAAFSFLIKFQAEKLAKFARKHLCQSFVLNKVAGWKISHNSQETAVPYHRKY